ncbi:hypothetical protein JT359_07005 [Candidatus Poribacteria bacterium]|nr:hypothetical protein [Candidatus Poribacteria bacterium]
MYDLDGLLTVIAAYPVHILTFLGCILLLTLVWPKYRKKRKYTPIPSESTAIKQDLTQSEKQQLVDKINENRMSGIKKSAAIGQDTKFMVFITGVLIVLTVIFIVGMIMMKFQKY